MDTDYHAGMEPQTGMATLDRERIFYLTWGERGRDVVLLHGLTSEARTWWRVAPELVAWGYRVWAIDLPGHGNSSGPATNYAFLNTARTVDAFLQAVGVHTPVVIGHSWGGAITLVQATEPGMVMTPQRIVLLDPLLRIPAGAPADYRQAMTALLGKPRAEQAERLRAAYPHWAEGDIYWKAEALEKASAAAVNGVMDDNPHPDLVPRLFQAKMPWAIIAADPACGGIIPPDADAELRAAAHQTHGHIDYMPGVPHDIYREDFEGTMQRLQAWLRASSQAVR